MKKEYITYYPVTEGNIQEEWGQCLEQIACSIKAGLRPMKLSIFVDAEDYPSFTKIREYITKSAVNTLGNICPAIGVTIHPPDKNFKVCIEGLFVPSGISGLKTRYWQSIPYIVAESGQFKEIWCAGLGNDLYWKDTRKAATIAFDSIVDLLEKEDMSLNHLVRQWNYIGNILGVRNGLQNYQVFNEVRSEYYGKFRTITGYPAATGVGMKCGGVFIDFCAIKADNSIKIAPVDNPNQLNAYEYGQNVLKGVITKGKTVKNPPQFERALLLINRTLSNLFISGTASIIGQETIGKGDIREQTIVTIENIKKLADIDRINRLAGNSDAIGGRYSVVRIYVKKREDFGVVREICNEHFPKTPAVYIEADICRDDLLTEIEGEFVV